MRKNIFCKLGLHKEAENIKYEVRTNGKHKWRTSHTVCKRCGKKLRRLVYLTKAKVNRIFLEEGK